VREFEAEATQLLSKKYTRGMASRYSNILQGITNYNSYIEKGIRRLEEDRPKYRQEMEEWSSRLAKAEVFLDRAKKRYYGTYSIYGIIYYIIHSNPDMVFTDMALAKWLKLPRTTVYYHISRMMKKGEVIKQKIGFQSVDGVEKEKEE